VRLVFSVPARRDVIEALAFIGESDPRAAERQNALLQQAARRLTRFPKLGAPMEGGNRRLQVRGTPFALIYREQGDTLTILRVWHGARQWPPASR